MKKEKIKNFNSFTVELMTYVLAFLGALPIAYKYRENTDLILFFKNIGATEDVFKFVTIFISLITLFLFINILKYVFEKYTYLDLESEATKNDLKTDILREYLLKDIIVKYGKEGVSILNYNKAVKEYNKNI